MKKIIVASLLVIGSMAYAGNGEHDTSALAGLLQDAPTSCGMPVECSKLSPLKRGICILKSLGLFGCTIACGAACLRGYGLLNDNSPGLNFDRISDTRKKLLIYGALVATAFVASDTLKDGVKQLSSVIAE